MLRLLVTAVSGIATFYFMSWMGGALLLTIGAPLWAASVLSLVLSLAAATATGRYVWTYGAGRGLGLAGSMMLGALVVGGVGFVAGFFGPMLLAPDANQGPMLGIFITGPLGLVFGAVGGAVYWKTRGPGRGADLEPLTGEGPDDR